MEKRSLMDKIFGKRPITEDKGSPFALVSTSSSRLTSTSSAAFDNDVVRSAIRPIATAVGKLEAKHIRGLDVVQNINELLSRPNPFMSMQDMLSKLVYQRELTHNAFAYVQRDTAGVVTGIYPVPFAGIELIEYQGEIMARFNFYTGKRMTVYYSDLIHLRKDFNSHDIYGDPPNTALKNVLDIVNTTDAGIVNSVKKSTTLKWLLKFKTTLRAEDRDLAVEDFTRNYLSIDNASGAAYSDPRYDVEQLKSDTVIPNAAQHKDARDRLYDAYNISQVIVRGEADEEQWLSFYESLIEPIAMQLSNAFTYAFFSQNQRARGNKIVFDSSNLVFASLKTKLELFQMVDRGAMTPNEWRRIMNMPLLDGGDEPIRRLDTVPVVEAIGGAIDGKGNQDDAAQSGDTKPN